MRGKIDAYVNKTFGSRVPAENVSYSPLFFFGNPSCDWVFSLVSLYGAWGLLTAWKIIWFKNWAKLKSIRSMEHFHVMMKDPDMEFIKEITKVFLFRSDCFLFWHQCLSCKDVSWEQKGPFAPKTCLVNSVFLA